MTSVGWKGDWNTTAFLLSYVNRKVRIITAIAALLTQMLKNEQVLTLPKES